MKTIAHRGVWTQATSENSLPALIDALNRGFAVETDIRLHERQVVLSHDPIATPESPVTTLQELLRVSELYPSALFFLNVKEDGLLPYLQQTAPWNRYRVVFFDMSTPELVKYARVIPKRNLATRWSDVENEPVLYDQCDWLWVDCFEQEINFKDSKAQKYLAEKQVVFVSPELHGRSAGRFLGEIELLERETQREMHICLDVGLSAL